MTAVRITAARARQLGLPGMRMMTNLVELEVAGEERRVAVTL